METIGRQTKKKVHRIDLQGGIFTAVQGKRQRPSYSFGPDGDGRQVMFQCPVSAIPFVVWQVLSLWNSCRLLNTLPEGGGLLDQSVEVQRFFPILNAEMASVQGNKGNTAEQAAMLAVGTMMKAMTGGR